MSFVDPDEQAAKEKAEKEGKVVKKDDSQRPTETMFVYLEKLTDAIKEGNKELKDIRIALEKIAFDGKVIDVKKAIEKSVNSTPIIKENPIKVEKKEPEIIKKQQPITEKANGSAGIFQSKFPTELASLLTFEDQGDWVKVSPKMFLTGEAFPKIATIIRELGGEYISAGRNSHFKVKKTA